MQQSTINADYAIHQQGRGLLICSAHKKMAQRWVICYKITLERPMHLYATFDNNLSVVSDPLQWTAPWAQLRELGVTHARWQ
jgi:hypothetical protein